jgi:YggT family protein
MTTFLLFIYYLCQVLTFAIFFRAILSWFTMNTKGSGFIFSLHRLLTQITEPILAPLRRIVPLAGMFDITPVIAILLLQILGMVVASQI